jgi:hypothetical protein
VPADWIKLFVLLSCHTYCQDWPGKLDVFPLLRGCAIAMEIRYIWDCWSENRPAKAKSTEKLWSGLAELFGEVFAVIHSSRAETIEDLHIDHEGDGREDQEEGDH